MVDLGRLLSGDTFRPCPVALVVASFGMKCDSGVEDLSFYRFVSRGSISLCSIVRITSSLSSKDPILALPTSANAKLSEDVPAARHSEV